MKSIICFLHVFFLLCFFSFSPIANGQEVGAEWVIPPVLESDDIEIPYDTWDFSRIVVKTNGKEGLCSRTGEVLIPIEYDHLKPKTDGWVVAFKDQKQFLFNDKIEPIGLPYDRFHAPGNRLSIVYKDDLCGLINEKGEEILPLKFNQVILLSYRK
ncbi:MAG: WG repeat-containing protein [Saprospiraceae bacterium]